MNPACRITLALYLFLLIAAHGNAQTITSLQDKVVGVADGDTITIFDTANKEQSIRLQGIDSPEMRRDFGEQAKQNLANLVYGRQVTIEYSKRDNYGHVLGKVLLLDGLDMNLEQIKHGLEWHYKQYEDEQPKADRKAYARAEREAREAPRGLWAGTLPMPPWAWRRTERKSDRQPTVAFGSIIGNNRTRIYHRPDCPNYNKVAPENKVEFHTIEQAEKAGYRAAKSCP